MKHYLVLIGLLLASTSVAKDYKVVSPDGKIKVTVNDRQQLRWQIDHEQTSVLMSSAMGFDGKVKKVTKGKVS